LVFDVTERTYAVDVRELAMRSIPVFRPTRKDGNRWQKKNCMMGNGMVYTPHQNIMEDKMK
jgi:hypothetical protein